jgi:hypothetical protein
MAFTPSNLTLASMGSLKLIIARVNASITSGTNEWLSGIPDILTVSGQYLGATTDASGTSLSISFTGSNGTIWTVVPLSQSATAFDLTVISGFGTDMTW